MRNLIYSIIFLAVTLHGYAQPPCGSNPPAGNSCATATPICELNGYCGNTSASYTANTWGASGALFGCGFLGLESCPGTGLTGVFCGSIENNSFLQFVASSTSISFDVWVNSSTLGYGIQILIFSAVNCSGNITQYGPCYNPGVVQPGPVNITAGGLTPGNTYYIMIDGNAGDVCNYTIGANTGISTPVQVSPETMSICPGESVSLTAAGGNGTYTWNASADLNTTIGANATATPPGPGTYTYTVNSATGNPLCPSATFATATITVDNCGCSVNATNTGSVCPGETFSLAASNVTDAVYTWSGPNGYSASGQDQSNLTAPLTPGNYTYTVTATVFGVPCTSETIVVVDPLPLVDAGSNQSVCEGTQVTLSGSGAVSFVWNNGVTDGVSFDPPSGATTYNVIGTDANGCVNTDNVTVTENTEPIVSAGTYPAVCSSTPTVALVGSPSGGVFSGTGVSGNVFNTSAGTQTITYAYTDGNTCSGSATAQIIVNLNPTVDAGANQAVCAGSSVTLAASGAASFSWSDGVVNNTSFIPTQTLNYTVVGTSAQGCTGTDNVTVTVNALPIVDAGTYSAICVDAADVALTGTPVGGVFSGTGVTANSFNPSVGTQTISYSYTDANDCSNSDQTLITVNPLPTVFGGEDVTICEGTAVTLAGVGAFSYLWTNGGVDGQPFTPSLGSIVYTVTGTDANGCVGIDNVTVTVVESPLAAVDADILYGYPVLDIVFTNNSTGATSYGWNFDNGQVGTVATTASQNVSYETPGTYIIELIAGNGICSDIDTIQIIVMPFPDPIVIVPNVFTPNGDGANDHFVIHTEYVEELDVVIFNRWGNVVHEIDTVTGHWDGQIGNKDASDGVYFYKYTLKGINGTELSGHGNITLVR